MAARKRVFVGIDVSKDRLDVHIRPLGSGFIVGNDATGHAGLIARLRALRVKRIVLEATGGYERALWLALTEAGLIAAVVNPRQVREFARASGRLAKHALGLDPRDRSAGRGGDRAFCRNLRAAAANPGSGRRPVERACTLPAQSF
jgi:transposase